MVTKLSILIFVLLSLFLFGFVVSREFGINLNTSASGIEFPQHPSFNVVSSSTYSGCNHVKSTSMLTREEQTSQDAQPKEAVKFHLRHRSAGKTREVKNSVFESTSRDLGRIQTLHTRIVDKKNQNSVSRLGEKTVISSQFELSGKLMATLESGVSHGSGEYFMDVFVGTPPKHFSLILDTGSDLNWIQCVPCYDCFEQNGPYYDPKDSSSFTNITCHDPMCHLVSSPDPPQPCKTENQTCPYYYWYGDSSNTTGDFALETFSVNLTTPSGNSEIKKVENVMFGCGHWNRGLFHGAAGLLGLGKGPLSFSSQLQSLYGHSFSYCLVNRNSNSSISSKLIFGEDKELLKHPNLNFTSLVGGKENPAETFYYVQIKSIIVGDQVLKIPEETWNMSPQGVGGTIIDSGTTLSYFVEPAYEMIKEAFVNKVKGYPLIQDFPILRPCYNVSGVENLELPSFGITFSDGAVWNFPVENYFIKLDPEDIVCLAILGTPNSAMSIIGNYQQQNFHILYDTKRSRLGYAPTNCADA
ncbi:aspartyl protease family protein 2-like [Solanum pennellii]|uniref:Aspartyl protease family protein 2-like n=1 Tax=Solanum pennellii TaxID=28526 RepID=A0ABM1GSD5_SOLPN|nr:aspartyl protease family protein 2-like [Solanum pennellii]